jgi:hypothetical protein
MKKEKIMHWRYSGDFDKSSWQNMFITVHREISLPPGNQFIIENSSIITNELILITPLHCHHHHHLHEHFQWELAPNLVACPGV